MNEQPCNLDQAFLYYHYTMHKTKYSMQHFLVSSGQLCSKLCAAVRRGNGKPACSAWMTSLSKEMHEVISIPTRLLHIVNSHTVRTYVPLKTNSVAV